MSERGDWRMDAWPEEQSPRMRAQFLAALRVQGRDELVEALERTPEAWHVEDVRVRDRLNERSVRCEIVFSRGLRLEEEEPQP